MKEKYHHCTLDAIKGKLLVHISVIMTLSSDLYTFSTSNVREILVEGKDMKNYISGTDIEEEMDQLIKAIGDKSRRKIIRLLKRQSLYVNEIAEIMGMSAATVCHHLSYYSNMKL